MKDARDRIVQHPARFKLTKVSDGVYDISPVPGTVTDPGTPITRNLLMAMQGFIGCDVTINDNGSITETNSDGETLVTSIDEDGNVVEIFTANGISIAKQTTFSVDGSIHESLI